MSPAAISIEPTGEKRTDACSCCGHESRCVWGLAHEDGAALAAYFVHWTPLHIVDRNANFDLIIGSWGDGAVAAERSAVALAYRRTVDGPAFMVIDARERPVAGSSLVGHVLDRDRVIGFPIADRAFAIADAILAGDDRIAELIEGGVEKRGARRLVSSWFAALLRRKRPR